jgi:hypothetical protein
MDGIGDRIVVESEKVDRAERRGIVIGSSGHMLKIRWDDGTESLMIPAGGSLRVVGHEDVTAEKSSR